MRNCPYAYRLTPQREKLMDRCREMFGISSKVYGWRTEVLDLCMSFAQHHFAEKLAAVPGTKPEDLRQAYHVEKTRDHKERMGAFADRHVADANSGTTPNDTTDIQN